MKKMKLSLISATLLILTWLLLPQCQEILLAQQKSVITMPQPDTVPDNFESQQKSLSFSKQVINFSQEIVPEAETSNITANSLNLKWENNLPSNSILMYGKTTAYELDTLTVGESSTSHEISLAGLEPATLYHIMVVSENGGEKICSPDRIFMTASAPESTGEINVYFVQSVDHSYATLKFAAGNVRLLNKFKERVSAAKYSIDVCYYIFFLPDAAGSLVRAKLRGCKIRVIVDNHYENDDAVQMLKNADIPVITDSFGSNSGSAAMHNKFVIVDHRDTTSAADDWVWLGSANMAESSVTTNAENVVEIQDQALAECYTIEFNEMWGSDTDVPDESQSRFGNRKTDNTPHEFNVNGIEILQYFSASDGGRDHLIEQISNSERSLYFCMLTFKQAEIANAMFSRWNSQDRVQVKGVFDRTANYNDFTSQYYNMAGAGGNPWNPPADVFIDPNSRTLHHKYLIIDGEGIGARPMVATGSYNWSYAAETSNDENFIIVKDASIANQYLQEFAARYHAAGGNELLTGVIETDFSRLPGTFLFAQNYPNPFNKITKIDYELQKNDHVKLIIFNLTGQEVKSFDTGFQFEGKHSIDWNGVDNVGLPIAGGVYFYRFLLMEQGINTNARKMIYLP